MALLFLHTDDVRHAIKDNNTLSPFVILKELISASSLVSHLHKSCCRHGQLQRSWSLKNYPECYTSQKKGFLNMETKQ